MSYGRIKTPRIYVDWINWLISIGRMSASDITYSSANALASGSSVQGMFDGDPTNIQTIECSGNNTTIAIEVDTNITTDSYQASNFIAILGHNLKEADAYVSIKADDSDGWTGVTITEVANATIGGGGTSFTPSNNGWSMIKWDSYPDSGESEKIQILIDDVDNDNYDTNIKIGAIVVGKYYDFPHPPDLKLSRDYQFNNSILQSRGGQRYSNLQTDPAKNWVLDKWSISSNTSPTDVPALGRRSYQLTYSFMGDTNLLPEDNDFQNLTETNSFYGDVLNKIQGSHIPFIFQTDNTATYTSASTPSDIMLARMFNIKMSQTAVNHWSVSMTIEEEA